MTNFIKSNLVQNDEIATLTAFFNGQMYIAENTHPNWAQIVTTVATATADTDLDALAQLFDPAVAVQDFFKRVSERVSISGGHVYFDGELMNDGLADHIIRFIEENEDDKAMALVNFMEKVQTNPNEHSREQLYDWLSRRDFTINDAGNFLAYKGVRPRRSGDDLDTYPWESINTGRATVDGKVYSGAIPNGIGAIVEMPRGEVAHDPNEPCHTGLHAGNYRYANSFAQGKLLLVEINPRDVVSVPNDSSSEKIRTCRYTVVQEIEQEITTSFWEPEDGELDVDYADEDHYDEANGETEDELDDEQDDVDEDESSDDPVLASVSKGCFSY